MNYTYKFDHNRYFKRNKAGILDIVTIEVDEYWYDILTALDKQEYNHERRETRRHQSYEVLEQLDDYLIPKQIYSGELSPEDVAIEKERRAAYYTLYDKILRQCGFLTYKQFTAFQLRALCDMPFKNIAYHMRFECQMNENEESAKKHYYNAIKKLRERFKSDYEELLRSLKEF